MVVNRIEAMKVTAMDGAKQLAFAVPARHGMHYDYNIAMQEVCRVIKLAFVETGVQVRPWCSCWLGILMFTRFGFFIFCLEAATPQLACVLRYLDCFIWQFLVLCCLACNNENHNHNNTKTLRKSSRPTPPPPPTISNDTAIALATTTGVQPAWIPDRRGISGHSAEQYFRSDAIVVS